MAGTLAYVDEVYFRVLAIIVPMGLALNLFERLKHLGKGKYTIIIPIKSIKKIISVGDDPKKNGDLKIDLDIDG